MASPHAPELVSAIEAAYLIDAPDRSWLKGIIDALRPSMASGLGIAGYLYDLADRPFRVREFMFDGQIDRKHLSSLFDPSNDDYVRRSWQPQGASTASEVPGYDRHPAVRDVFRPAGIHDIFVLNTLDPLGVGCWIGAPLPAHHELVPTVRERWNRVAAHIRSALRLRLRVASKLDGAGATEAVFTPGGRVKDIASEGADRDREPLRKAVISMERARHQLRNDADRALPSWKALVQGRWSLLDDFQVGGERYIVAKGNAFPSSGSPLLTERERQIVTCFAMGLTSKETAYELGISDSTVRVHAANATAKLGAKDRNDLVARFRKTSLG